MTAHPSLVSIFQTPEVAHALFNEAGDGLLLVDPATERIIEANPMACRLCQLQHDDLLQVPIRLLLRHRSDWQDWLEPLHQTRTFHGMDGYLLRTPSPDIWIPVNITISRLHPLDGETLALFTLRDRSEAVEAERRQQRMEGEMRQILNSVSDCLWSCRIDADGRWSYRYLSPVVQRMTGRLPGVFLEDPTAWQQVVAAEDLPAWRAFVTRLTRGQSGDLDYRLIHLDHSIIWVRESVRVTPEEGGTWLLHGVMTDISYRKHAEEIHQRQEQYKMRHLESLAELSHNLAGEFGNLATGLLKQVNSLRTSLSPASDDPPPPLLTVEEIARQAATLGQELLTLSGRANLVRQPNDLNAIVRDVVQSSIGPEGTSHRIDLELESGLMAVPGDPAQLPLLLRRLIENAREALSTNRGRIVIRTGALPAPSPTALVAQIPTEHSLTAGAWIEVQDTGPGLAPEVIPRLFEPFFSTKPPNPGRTTSTFLGRGLGLASALGIVRAHQGTIQVESAPGKGTTIRVLFPAGSILRPPAPQAPAPRGVVLLVDDEDAVRQVACRILQSIGCRVLEAADGLQALEMQAEHGDEIQVILLDLTMPRMSGEMVLRRLRERGCQVPVLLISGHADPDTYAHLAPLNPSGYLQKPFRMQGLVDAVTRRLPS